jgi:hypothetical protein
MTQNEHVSTKLDEINQIQVKMDYLNLYFLNFYFLIFNS